MAFNHVCEHCQIDYTARQRERRYCSRECKDAAYMGWRKEPLWGVCEVCTTPFVVKPYRRLTARFCSRACVGVALQGKPQCRPTYDGKTKSNGYIYCYMPSHPGANPKGYVAEHRLVMEEVLGRYLTTEEVVHHKNHRRTDNAKRNLQVMTQAEHARLHLEGNDYASRIGWSYRHERCVSCGTDTVKHAARGLCQRCYKRAWVSDTLAA